jgi:hypothetical protein
MIDQYPSANGVLTSLIWRKTMSGGETSLSGYDNASQALSYTPGQEQVYLNGILLVRGDDYTATNGTSITGLAALAASDFVQINCYNNFSVATTPATSITGEITNSQITSLATSKLTGTITNAQLAGSISNDKLSNSSITINGSAVSLGGSATIAGGSAQDSEPTSPTEGQLWLDTNGTLATTAFTEKSTLTTTGDIYYASAADTPARLAIGSTDQVLKVSGGIPAWAAPAAGGKVLQVVSASTTTSVTITSTSFQDSGLSASITPSSATSKVLILITQPAYNYRSANGFLIASQILRDATQIAFNDKFARFLIQTSNNNEAGYNAAYSYLDSPATTSSTTYKTQYKTDGNGATVELQSNSSTSQIILMEIGA